MAQNNLRHCNSWNTLIYYRFGIKLHNTEKRRPVAALQKLPYSQLRLRARTTTGTEDCGCRKRGAALSAVNVAGA